MIYINFNDLNEETKERLFQNSKKDVEKQFGSAIRNYAKKHYINYNTMLEEEATRNLYNYKYVFNI
jgi:cation transport regulator ChaB